jgi:3-hydroxyisobutyrate dehydrogenase-like beta-hydroxyacid dehydrogenase
MTSSNTNHQIPLRKIGFVGLGIMGSAMAEHLLNSGFAVVGYDVEPKARNRLKSWGGKPLGSVQGVLQHADIIITSLPSGQALKTVTDEMVLEFAGDKGLQKVLIETSTLPIQDKEACAKKLKSVGIVALDCPIIGTVSHLKNRLWTIYASGPKKTYQDVLPLLREFTDDTPYLGAYGSGTKMKLAANHLVAIYNVAYAESVTLARKMGLDPRDVLQHFGNSPILGTGVMRSRMAMMVERNYAPPTMKVEVWQKDMGIIGDLAKTLNCPTPLFSASADIYTAAMAQNLALEDTAATAEVLASMAGIKPLRNP